MAGGRQAGNTLDTLVTKKRDKRAAKRFLRKLLRSHPKPRVVVSDKLRSYGAALKELLPWTEHRQSRYLNNRAENSHQRTRRRERALQRFKSPGHAQRFLAVFEPLNRHFRPPRHLLKARAYRQKMQERFSTWRDVTELALSASVRREFAPSVSVSTPSTKLTRLEQVQQIQQDEVPAGTDMATWALAWCLQHPAVSCVIPGCKTVAQVEANARAADLDIVREDHPQAFAEAFS
jgi:hypothetical protein